MLFGSLKRYRPILWTVYLKPASGPTRSVLRDLKGWAALDKVEELRLGGHDAWAIPD